MIGKKGEETSSRKDDHLNICINEKVEFTTKTNGFQKIDFHPSNLIDISPENIDLRTEFLGKELNFPLIISGMTGGSALSKKYNEKFAEVCQKFKIGMGVGSQRAAIENPELSNTFQIRHIAPDIPLIANLGLIQFNNGYGTKEAQKAVEMINADALAIHLNPLQELIQTEGNKNFHLYLENLRDLIKIAPFPIIVKGVGTGLTKNDAKVLSRLQPYAIDIAGAGGTNWNKIEYLRNKKLSYLSTEFLEQGISTARSLIHVRHQTLFKKTKIIASGGIWTGSDAIKALILGADYVAFALPALRALAKGGTEELEKYILSYTFEMQTIMALLGSSTLKELRKKIHKKIGRIFVLSA
ncbi:MAG: type 2 isopentenyl-diphosphate Delta-isomerase [Candidatus Heimdallarchaeaceae archaeon]